ncbi:MAG: YebC/PmpR family DNA-binding transcriptional regulator [Rikenellaceae bacterium]
MGRAFEFRKARKMKRWGNMARVFTRLGKEIAIAVKAGGPDPHNNPRLRVLMQNAKSENMPKENVERAIKRAISKDMADYKEMVYEGYAPFGIAVLVETATDNTTRTVANVRACFNKAGGSLGTSGSLSFMFDHKCTFVIKPTEDLDIEEFELEIIDCECDEIEQDEDGNIVIFAPFEAYGKIQKFLDDKGMEIIKGEFTRIPTDLKEVSDEQRAAINKMIEKMEDDDDVTNVYTNMVPDDSDDDEQE